MAPSRAPVTADLARTFADTGFLVLANFLDTKTVDRLRTDADTVLTKLLSTMAATQTTDKRVTWWRLPSGQTYVLKIKPVLDMALVAKRVATSDELRQLAGELLGAPPQLMEDKFMYKQRVMVTAPWAELPVLGEEVCKHTDAAYFAARGYTRRVLTVAVCLDDCTEQAGALRVWPGTHERSIEQVVTARQGPVVPDHVAPDDTAVVLAAPAGSVLAWDAALVHASGPNTSGKPRRLLVLGYTSAPF